MMLDTDPPRARDAQAGWVEATAQVLASLDRADAEARIDVAINDALKQWRLDDAVQWQRVRYRARHLRARLPSRPTG